MRTRIAIANIDTTIVPGITDQETTRTMSTDVNAQGTPEMMMKIGINGAPSTKRPQIRTKIYQSQMMKFLSQSRPNLFAIRG
jgi:hypothetical protein